MSVLAQARLKTPPADAPLLLVLHFGNARRCINLCRYCERRGFLVQCGDKYAKAPRALAFVPDVILVRIAGAAPQGDVRPQFWTLGELRSLVPETPIVAMLLDGTPNASERAVAKAVGASLFEGHRTHSDLLHILYDAVNLRRS